MSEPIYIDIEVVEPITLTVEEESTINLVPLHTHDQFVSSDEISIIKRLTQAEYNALGSYVSTTMYVIVG